MAPTHEDRLISRVYAAMNPDLRSLAIASAIAVAPIAIIMLGLIIRGYTIFIHLTRNPRDRDRKE